MSSESSMSLPRRLAYGLEKKQDETIAVYDLGGGHSMFLYLK
jgi:hypothetical protein